jgi:putative restriction endonuclease
MLLAILESFDEKEIDSNWIGINEALLIRFYDLWNLLVKTKNAPNFSLTFFHLGNERRGLWNLISISGKSHITTHKFFYKSLKVLKETFLGAQLSDEFYNAVKCQENRDTLKHALLDTYFPKNSARQRDTALRYSKKIEKQILFDAKENYADNMIRQEHEETIESKEEEVILRNYIFRKAVLETYNNQCAISGLKIESSDEELLVDACHIVPFTHTSDDSIRNGIALSPTLHRAFDNGLIAIDDNYIILVPHKLKDYNPAVGIRQYADKKILLPREEEFYPSRHRLAEHRVRFGYE